MEILFHQGIFSQLVPGQQIFLLSCILGFHLGTTERHVWFWHRFCLLQQLEVPEPICLPSLGVEKNGQIALLALSSLQLKCLMQVIQGFPQTVCSEAIMVITDFAIIRQHRKSNIEPFISMTRVCWCLNSDYSLGVPTFLLVQYFVGQQSWKRMWVHDGIFVSWLIYCGLCVWLFIIPENNRVDFHALYYTSKIQHKIWK